MKNSKFWTLPGPIFMLGIVAKHFNKFDACLSDADLVKKYESTIGSETRRSLLTVRALRMCLRREFGDIDHHDLSIKSRNEQLAINWTIVCSGMSGSNSCRYSSNIGPVNRQHVITSPSVKRWIGPHYLLHCEPTY